MNTLTAGIKSDDVLDLVYGLKRPYRKNASFIMNDGTLAQLRKLKDNNGAYIWQPSYQVGEPDRVLGYEVHTSAYARRMPFLLVTTNTTISVIVVPDPSNS